MKKTLAMILALCMLFVLCACGQQAAPAPAAEPAPAEEAAPAEATVDDAAAAVGATNVVASDTAVGEFTAEGELSCDLTGITLGFIYQDLETEFWVEAYNWAMKNMKAAGATIIEYNAKEDVNKQLEMAQDACAQGVDGILVVPQDSDSAVAVAQVCNEANIPVAFVNRVPSDMTSCNSIACMADNEGIARGAMEYCLEKAVEMYGDKKLNIIDMIGDLGDVNAIYRENGFRAAMEKYKDNIGEVYEVSTQWDANVALAGLQTVLQQSTDVQVLCCGSDFMYPQIESALEEVGLWKTRDQDGHVWMCAVDGDSGAAAYMDKGYVDATGVQDVYNECRLCIEALYDAITSGETQPNALLTDPGVAQTADSMIENRHAMWGFQVLDAKS